MFCYNGVENVCHGFKETLMFFKKLFPVEIEAVVSKYDRRIVNLKKVGYVLGKPMDLRRVAYLFPKKWEERFGGVGKKM